VRRVFMGAAIGLSTLALSLSAVPASAQTTPPGGSVGSPGPGSGPVSTVAAQVTVAKSGPGLTASFRVSFDSATAGRGQVLFGPACNDLIETATMDSGIGSTHHAVTVTGDDLNGGSAPVLPGQTYAYEVQTVSATGVLTDNNNGSCYQVVIPSSPTGLLGCCADVTITPNILEGAVVKP